MRVLLLFAVTATACSFTPGALPTDASPDGPPPITVGFASATTATDEAAGTVPVRVVLSQAADEAITVDVATTGGSATATVDYTGGTERLTFAPGDVEETVDIVIGPDGSEEPDETIELGLASATGAGAVLARDSHTLTISASVLPRVTFSVDATTGAESTSPTTINAVLDIASLLTTSVEVEVMGGTATSGADYTLDTTTLTFAPGETTKPITLTVIDDALDEADETAAIQLVNGVNIIVGTASTTTHTITDNDATPTVSFAAASSTIAEGGTMTDLTVSLSAASGLTVTVPFTVGTSTATVTADYTLGTASPLVFAPGETQKTIRVNVVQDTAAESTETVVIELGTATNAGAGANPTHTLSITDDDQTCVGAGNYTLCFATPAATASISGTLDTDSSPLCSATGPLSGWSGGPDSCFVVGTTVTIAATAVTGSRPLVVFASGAINVTGNIDAASHRAGTTGPGTNIGCTDFTGSPSNSTSGASGGAGGTFRSIGGTGGSGNGTTNTGGTPVGVGSAPTTLRGGCIGQKGGNGNGANGGEPGEGGGSLYFAAGGQFSVNANIAINVSGAAATALTTPNSGFFGGGGGGGSGGMIVIRAATVSVADARFMANGGGGSSGADDNSAGDSGEESATATPTAGGAGGNGANDGANGGGGFGSTTAVGAGSNGGSNNAGGGGGGGGGYVLSNLALTNATVSAADASVVP